ncbi:hypothetical protein V1477_012342 [Vespula maculifrons]|uniref:Uncharacterized protein n=1 Tax=Vespula maculifrons TaxID=7453 RepID=A0ABD2BXA0_VESMC
MLSFISFCIVELSHMMWRGNTRILLVIGRQVAYLFLCDCVFNFKQVGPDKTQVAIFTLELKVVPSPGTSI